MSVVVTIGCILCEASILNVDPTINVHIMREFQSLTNEPIYRHPFGIYLPSIPFKVGVHNNQICVHYT